MHAIGRFIIAYIIAWIIFDGLGIIASSLFTIRELTAMDVDVPFMLIVQTILHDIVHMTPLFGSIFGIGLLIAFLLAGQVIKLLDFPPIIYSLAGFCAIVIALAALKISFNVMPIAAARHWDGFLVLAFIGALSGLSFAYMRRTG